MARKERNEEPFTEDSSTKNEAPNEDSNLKSSGGFLQAMTILGESLYIEEKLQFLPRGPHP